MQIDHPFPFKQGTDGVTPPTILLIDDEEAFCEVVSETLKYFGYASLLANNAEDAIAILDENTPDLILLDLMMPEVDGLTLIYKLRSRMDSSSIPIIVLTAKATSDDKNTALLAGADAFLSKPFSMGELHDIVNTFLSPSQS